jgi:hypothetical protein
MAKLALALLALSATIACTFWIAGGLYGHGSAWARDICSMSPALCAEPFWGAVVTGAIGLVYLMLRALRL